MWLRLATVAAVVPLLAWAPGMLLVTRLRGLSEEERAALAPACGLAFLALAAFGRHLVGSPAVVNAVFWAALVGAGAASVGRRPRPDLRRSLSWRLVGLWALFYVALLGLQGMTPIYAGGDWGGDWWEHYSIAQAYLGGQEAYSLRWFNHDTLASRTPLFNLAAAFTLSLMGDRFWVYQVHATFSNSLFVLPFYLMVKQLHGTRAALLATVFAFFNTWLVHNTTFTWTKMTMAGFLLLSLCFYLRFRRTLEPASLYWSALLGGLAVMTHQGAVCWLAALAVDYLWLAPRTARSASQASCAAAIVVALVLPWYVWIHAIYGVGQMVRVVPAMSMGAWNWAPQARGILENTVTSIVPMPLLDYVLHGKYAWTRMLFRLVEFYFNPLAGAMTLSLMAVVLFTLPRPGRAFALAFHRLAGPRLCAAFGGSMLFLLLLLFLLRPALDPPRFGAAPLVWGLALTLIVVGFGTARRSSRVLSAPLPADADTEPSRHLTALVFALVGFWGGLLVHPGGERQGIASNALVPSVLVVIAYGISRVAKLRPWALATFFAGVLVEFCVTWAFLGSLIADGPSFRWDSNHGLKTSNNVTFLYDEAGGRWLPFAAVAFLAQVAGALAVKRSLRAEREIEKKGGPGCDRVRVRLSGRGFLRRQG